MVFSSLLFLYYFLPLVLSLYYLAPHKLRNLVLFAGSLFFYAWGEPVYIVLMIFSSLSDFGHGLLIDKYRNREQIAKWLVASAVAINLGLLGFFKYADFLILNLNAVLDTNFTPLHLPLPIGISFYTFQTMSYSIDVYRGDAPVQRSFLNFATYVTLFPQLIAGPIVRYNTIAHELTARQESWDSFSQGVKRFVIGLGKKVLLANNIGLLWTEIQKSAPSDLTVLTAWLGIIAFGFQIYYDFSGYSDMAIGLGRMFGFTFPENFHYPFISRSITEFWRRWHISLGSWFRDYLYIPLGGSRTNKLRSYCNLFFVWLLTGFWHGASWNFVLWGLYLGLLIAIERIFLLQILKRIHKVWGRLYLFAAVTIGWVLFVFDNYAAALNYLRVMFGLAGTGFWDTQFLYRLVSNAILLGFLILGATPLPNRLWEQARGWLPKNMEIIAVSGIYLLLLIGATAYLVDATYNPFLYFRF